MKNKEIAREECRDAIESYLGSDARGRFESKREKIKEKVEGVVDKHDLRDIVDRIEVD